MSIVDQPRVQFADPVYGPLEIDAAVEAECFDMLYEFAPQFVAEEFRNHHVRELMTLDGGFLSRFQYAVPQLPDSAFRRLLISGCSAGSEMIVARQFGFQEIHGTEVAQAYVDICRKRLAGGSGFEVVCYDGGRLPYANSRYSCVISAHIIEHTPSPFDYLREHMRVLEPGGWMFLEFPNRYHWRELHTRLPSVEYLPGPLRRAVLKLLSSRWSPLSAQSRQRYESVLNTLSPVSIWQVRSYLRKMGLHESRIVHHYAPAPGYTRMLIEK